MKVPEATLDWLKELFSGERKPYAAVVIHIEPSGVSELEIEVQRSQQTENEAYEFIQNANQQRKLQELQQAISALHEARASARRAVAGNFDAPTARQTQFTGNARSLK